MLARAPRLPDGAGSVVTKAESRLAGGHRGILAMSKRSGSVGRDAGVQARDRGDAGPVQRPGGSP